MNISVAETLELLKNPRSALIDVRSETEYEVSGVPGFQSLPLLYQSERCEVGKCYKTEGQAAAIQLGHKLVDPHRPHRVQSWGKAIAASPSQNGIVMCWRGGLRSQIATSWMQEQGLEARRLEGGYRALRHCFLETLRSPPPLLMLTGFTGSGKTEIIRHYSAYSLDIEGAACHRGSSFGQLPVAQPTQSRFENALALNLLKPWALVEDESRTIGRLAIPEGLFWGMQKAPRIFLESPLEERTARIYQEYVTQPLASGLTPEALEENLTLGLQRLRRRLDFRYPQVLKELKQSFRESPSLEAHTPWIESLLIHYYDRCYTHAANKSPRPFIFRGPYQDCAQFIQHFIETSC